MPRLRTIEYDLDSVKGLANFLEVTPSTIYRWIKNGDVFAHKENGRLTITHDKSGGFISRKLDEKWKRHREAWVPQELEDYTRFR